MIYIARVKHKSDLYKGASEKYFEILNSISNRASKILFITYTPWTIQEIKKKFKGIEAEEAEIYTLNSFIKKEINLYWPIIESKLKEKIYDKKERLIPYLIDQNISNDIISSIVEDRRNNKDYFNTITSTTKNIVKSLYFNMKSASELDTDIYTSGEKIYYSKRNRDIIERSPYSENDEIIEEYIEYMLSKSAIDNSLAVYLYSNILLEDKRYINAVNNRYRFVVVDCMERINNTGIKLIEKMNDNFTEISIFSCKEMNISSFLNFDKDNANKKIYDKSMKSDFFKRESLNQMDKNEIEEINYINNTEKYENNTANYKRELNVFSGRIKGCYQSQLYTEMINDIVERVSDIYNEKSTLNNINVIMPPASDVSANLLCRELNKRGINAATTIVDINLYNSEIAMGIITAVSIYENSLDKTEPYEITEQGMISLIHCLLGSGIMKSRLLYKKYGYILEDIVHKNNTEESETDDSNTVKSDDTEININDDINTNMVYDEYTVYKNKITEFKDDMNIYIKEKTGSCELIRRIYTDNISEKLRNTENIKICKRLAQEYEKLEKAIKEGILSKNNAVNILIYNINEYITMNERKELENENIVMITGISDYINSMSKRDIQLWADVGNPMWSPKIAKELGNSEVLKKSYPEKMIFTDLYEGQIRKEYLYNTMYSLMDAAKDIYIFKSDYSINGFIQDSTMYSWILKLLDN